MSLARALARLPDDIESGRVLRDVLVFLRRHKGEWLSEADIRMRTGLAPADVRAILPVLVDAFVLDFDRATERYRYEGDVALAFEVDAFVRRIDCAESHVRTNVAKFRERYGA